METKEFFKSSSEHAGINKGSKFKLIKLHHEVQGDINEGAEVELCDIVHFPTRYRMKDDEGKIWTIPTHSVEQISE
tara:strand:+ start:323 stop:550 length:228 start_codon:yes stop_codon:yes gene_type:complete